MKTKEKSLKVILKLFLTFLFVSSLVFAVNLVHKKITDSGKNIQVKPNTVPTINTVKTSNKPSNFKICIDAGHGDNDNGTQSALGVFEKDIALSVSLKIGEILKRKGVSVIYTRTSDKTSLSSNIKLNLRERVKISNDAKSDVFISIHCNGQKNASYKGIETWCRFTNSEGEKLAKGIQVALVNSNYSSDRGLKYEANGSLAVLKLNNSVSALVELGFLTNSSDSKFISSESGQDVCAEAIAKAILNYKEQV